MKYYLMIALAAFTAVAGCLMGTTQTTVQPANAQEMSTFEMAAPGIAAQM